MAECYEATSTISNHAMTMDLYEQVNCSDVDQNSDEDEWSIKKQSKSWSSYIFLLITPLLLCPLVTLGKEGRAAFVILLMALYWIFEVAPIGVVALLPVLLYPLFGIMKASEISMYYLTDINMLFLCGLMIAAAVESWNLHKRIALKVILCIGAKPERILIGFMLTTAFISMWMSNTATTAMMAPIAEAVLVELEKSESKRKNENPRTFQIDTVEMIGNDHSDSSEEIALLNRDNKKSLEDKSNNTSSFNKNVCTALMLSIAFSANIGGTATLIGTGPNIILVGQLERLFGPESNISFLSWFVFAFPVCMLILFGGWLCLDVMYLRCSFIKYCCTAPSTCCHRRKKSGSEVYDNIVRNEYKKLGKMKFAEKAVLFHFVLVAMLWLLRDPKFIPGWSYFFQKGYVSDATGAMLVVLLLFVFPSEKPKLFCWNFERKITKPPIPLLTWETISKKFAWHLIILLGGGLAMAAGAKESGLTQWLGCQLTSLSHVPIPVMGFIVCLLVAALTEVSSNVATISLFLPIVATIAQSTGVHPYYLMIPSTIASSFAFMLPVATAPNAIVFSSGRITVKDMLKTGVWMDVVGVLVLMVAINTYGYAYFELDILPPWASAINSTAC